MEVPEQSINSTKVLAQSDKSSSVDLNMYVYDHIIFVSGTNSSDFCFLLLLDSQNIIRNIFLVWD